MNQDKTLANWIDHTVGKRTPIDLLHNAAGTASRPRLAKCGLKTVAIAAALWGLSQAAWSHGPNAPGAIEIPAEMERVLAQRPHHPVCFHHNDSSAQLPAHMARAALKNGGYLGPCMNVGDRRSLGDGQVSVYTQILPDGTPYGIGFVLTEKTLRDLPTDPADGATCFDLNGDTQIDIAKECVGGHAFELDFPQASRRALAPFKWALVNWNPAGHGPSGIYDRPHFDFHFYMQPLLQRNLIRAGPCGTLMNCSDLARAIKPLAAEHMPKGYANVNAVEARMGNHLINPSAPEFIGNPFSSTFIYGSYDGTLTFMEPMLTLELLSGRPFFCRPIAQPAAYQTDGHYPRQYCVKYYPARKEYHVALEDFVYRRGR